MPFPNDRSGVIGLAIAGNPENDRHLAPWQEAPGHEIIEDTHRNGSANETTTGLHARALRERQVPGPVRSKAVIFGSWRGWSEGRPSPALDRPMNSLARPSRVSFAPIRDSRTPLLETGHSPAALVMTAYDRYPSPNPLNGAAIVNALGPIHQTVRDDTGTASHPGAIAQLSTR